MKQKGSLTTAAIFVFIITILSKVLAFVREIIFSYKFGAGDITDAYFVAMSVPTVLFACLFSGVTESYVPIISRIEDRERQHAFNGNVMLLLTVACTLFSFLFLLLKRYIVAVVAPGFTGNALDYTILFVSIFVFLLPARGIFCLIAGYLSYRELFASAAFFDFIVVNLVSIISFLVATKETCILLPIIYVGGYFLTAILSFVYAKKQEFRMQISFQRNNKQDLLDLLTLTIPYGLSLMITQLNSLIDRALASTLATGSVSYLNYANNIIQLILTLSISIFTTVTHLRLNKAFVENNIDAVKALTSLGIRLSVYICIPATLGVVVYAKDIIGLVYLRGSFGTTDLVGTAGCLALYGVGLLFFALRKVISAVLSANKMPKAILVNNAIAVSCNIAISLLLKGIIGVYGLALGTSLAGMISFTLMMRKYNATVGKSKDTLFFPFVCKVLVCSFVAVGVSYVLNMLLSQYMRSYSIIAAVLSAVIVYYLLSVVFRIEERKVFENMIKGVAGKLLRHSGNTHGEEM